MTSNENTKTEMIKPFTDEVKINSLTICTQSSYLPTYGLCTVAATAAVDYLRLEKMEATLEAAVGLDLSISLSKTLRLGVLPPVC